MPVVTTLQRNFEEAPSDLIVDFRSLLLAELQAAYVLPDSIRYEACRRAVTRAGVEECVAMQVIVGARLWDWLMTALQRPDPRADCERVLGFGSLLTEWMLPPIAISSASRRDVVALGALANFIVTVFDHLADESSRREQPIPSRVLQRAIGGDTVPLVILTFVGKPPARLLALLVRAYLQRLHRLPFASRHAGVRSLLMRAIFAMHAAELETLRAGRTSDRAVRAKSLLPWVVMGMATWLAAEDVHPPTFRAHLRWLHRLGDVLGVIDDVADARGDAAAGRSNRIVSMLRGSSIDGAMRLARSIARRTTRLTADRARLLGSEFAGDAPSDILGAVVISWLGGTSS